MVKVAKGEYIPTQKIEVEIKELLKMKPGILTSNPKYWAGVIFLLVEPQDFKLSSPMIPALLK